MYFKVLTMDSDKYRKDIEDIKNLMNRSSTFLSLSGFSGVLAGVYALVGAYVANEILQGAGSYQQGPEQEIFRDIAITAAAVLLLSLITAGVLTYLKAEKAGENIWNTTSRRMLINFLIPLVTGGAFALLLLRTESYSLIAAVMLIFYGLACVNASKYTLHDVRYLGLTVIVLGLVATALPQHALLLWALGFGICHIIYGAIMYFKYDRK